MQFSTLFIAAALPFLISASPAQRRSNAASVTPTPIPSVAPGPISSVAPAPISSAAPAPLPSVAPARRRSNAATTPNNKDLQVRQLDSIKPRANEEAGCSFTGRIGNAYIPDPVGDGESCFGFDNGGAINCGGPYEQEELDNIKKAVADQVTKDGWLKSSDAGEWTATFQTFTTAFEDRDTSAFDETLDAVNVEGNSGAGELTYYWQRKGDYLMVRRSACPGSLFEKN